MSVAWVPDDSGLTLADIERRQEYKFVAHHFVQRKRFPWLVCKRCGLLLLRNALTAWCEKHGCNADDHSAYRAAVARLARRSA